MNHMKWGFLKISFLCLLIECIVSCTGPEFPKPAEDPAFTQWAKEVNAIDSYLKINFETSYIAYSNSGVRMLVKKFGDDIVPRKGQIVDFSYVARTFGEGGFVYDSAKVSKVLEDITITGLSNWLTSLQKGTIATIFVPSRFAYGTTDYGKILANSTVSFDITINGVSRTVGEAAQFTQDTLTLNAITSTIPGIIKHPSGLRYTISTVTPTGKLPKVFDNISYEYTGSLLSTGAQFVLNSSSNQNIFELIDALKIGIPLMKETSTATFYIPSGLAYGATGTTGIPANSNIKFVITLNSIVKP
jgi:FKBP-type peptidyl-prolyl cis-trans isomerase